MNKDSTTFTDKNQSGMSCLLEAVESVTSDLLGGTTGTYTPNQSRYVLDCHRLPPLPTAHNYSIARPRVVPPIRPYSSPGNYVSTDRYSVERDYVQRFNDAAPSQYYQHENIGSSPSMPPSTGPWQLRRRPLGECPNLPAASSDQAGRVLSTAVSSTCRPLGRASSFAPVASLMRRMLSTPMPRDNMRRTPCRQDVSAAASPCSVAPPVANREPGERCGRPGRT